MKRRLIGVLLIGVLVLGLAACGSPSTPDTANAPGPADSGGSSAAPESKPVEIIVANSGTPNGLDPVSEDTQGTILVCNMFYDHLVEISASDNSWVPAVAKSWNQVDATTWTFEINLDYKFSNGDQLTMEDVKFSIERLADIAKAADASKGIASVSYEGTTLTIKLVAANNTIIPQIMYVCVIVNKAYIEKGGDDAIFTNPIGTGPYVVTSFTPGGEVVVESWEGYPFQKPQVDKITFRAIPEDSARYIAVESGQVHFAGIVSPMELKLAQDSGKFTIINQVSQRTGNFIMNTERKPFDDVNVRRAMAYAFDREAICSLSGGRQPVLSPLFGGFLEYHEPANLPTYDPAKAKELLEAAGISPQNPITVDFKYWIREPGVEVFQAELQKLGVNLDLQFLEFSVFLQSEGAGDFDMIYTANRNLAGSALMDTQRVDVNFIGSRNLNRWVSNEAQAVIDQMLTTPDQSQMKSLAAQLSDLVGENVPIIPVFLQPAICVMDPKLSGIEVRGDMVTLFRNAVYSG